MNSNKSITANLATSTTSYTLTVTVNPVGGGTVAKSPNMTQYPAGTEVTLTAASSTGYAFNNWSGDASGTGLSVSVTMDSNKSITANFAPRSAGASNYTLTVSVSPAGRGTVTKSPSASQYAAGTVVTLTAKPGAGYAFSNWSGGASGSDPSLAVTMNSNTSVTANFVPSSGSYALNVAASPAGSGTIARSPNMAQYPAGTVVTLTITPTAGYEFSHWSGDASGSGSSLTVTMDSNKSVTVSFSQILHTLTIRLNGSGSIVPSVGSHEYREKTVVNITATPDNGWKFKNWTGNVADANSANTTLTVDSDRTITANFSQIGTASVSWFSRWFWWIIGGAVLVVLLVVVRIIRQRRYY